MTDKLKAAPKPCGSCPYRCDVPSAIWAKHEYNKLPDYDGPLAFQCTKVFMCHQNDGGLCAGWVACHGAKDLLALRLSSAMRNDVDPTVWDYQTSVPVFKSGAAARKHGIKGMTRPTVRARKMVAGLLRKQGKGK